MAIFKGEPVNNQRVYYKPWIKGPVPWIINQIQPHNHACLIILTIWLIIDYPNDRSIIEFSHINHD